MSLPGQVEGAISSVSGFDSDTIISPALAQQFYSMGYRFCLRYLSPDNEAAGDLSTQEATDILNSGLALMPVQHVLDPLWSPSQSLGQEYGQNAAANTQTIGFPPGVNVWCDLEAVNPATNAQDVVDYCRAWYQAVDSSEYVPGLLRRRGSHAERPATLRPALPALLAIFQHCAFYPNPRIPTPSATRLDFYRRSSD
jgi:hypothetical protein